jgi:transcriptional regulator with XRE-family HTH domain
MRYQRPPSDMLSEQFAAIVRAELDRKGWTITELARRLGVPRPNVSKILSDPGSVRSSTVVAYFNALGLDPSLRAKRQATQPPKEGAKK